MHNRRLPLAQVMLFRLQPPNEAQPLFLVGVEDVEERKRAAVLQRENETLQQQKLDSLRYKAVVDHTRTLVFEWRGTELNYLSHRTRSCWPATTTAAFPLRSGAKTACSLPATTRPWTPVFHGWPWASNPAKPLCACGDATASSSGAR